MSHVYFNPKSLIINMPNGYEEMRDVDCTGETSCQKGDKLPKIKAGLMAAWSWAEKAAGDGGRRWPGGEH